MDEDHLNNLLEMLNAARISYTVENTETGATVKITHSYGPLKHEVRFAQHLRNEFPE